MKILVIIKSPPVSQVVHEIAVKTIESLCSDCAVEISGIFFTDSSVSLASKGICQLSNLGSLQTLYQNLSQKRGIPLYVCGRAFMEHGLDKSNLGDEFCLAGNMELSMMICSADRVMEF